MSKTLVFWFTGLSGSGKTTLVKEAESLLAGPKKKIKVYDGDLVRQQINKNLKFTPRDIKENNKIIAKLCLKDINSNRYDYIFVPVISPFEESRGQAKKILGSTFSLVYCRSSLEGVIKRDPKGLYKKALSGQLSNFIGIAKEVPYQPPANADLVLDTEKQDLKTCVTHLINFISLKEK